MWICDDSVDVSMQYCKFAAKYQSKPEIVQLSVQNCHDLCFDLCFSLYWNMKLNDGCIVELNDGCIVQNYQSKHEIETVIQFCYSV